MTDREASVNLQSRLSGRLARYSLAAGAAGVAVSGAQRAEAEPIVYDPPEGLVTRVASVFKATDGDIAQVVRAILSRSSVDSLPRASFLSASI